MVSVAMTTYNGEKYILDQLASLHNQTMPPDEVVIFDDNSTDNTVSLVRGFIEENQLDHWHLAVNSSNLGFVRNFYQAIDATSGDYIFLCDQDDMWHADKIERMVTIFLAHPDIYALNASFEKIDNDGAKLPFRARLGRSNCGLIKKVVKNGALVKIGLDSVLWRNISPGCTAAFTHACRELFTRNRTGLCPHDWEINLFGAVMNGLYFYSEPLTEYRIHGDNTIGLVQLKAGQRLSAVLRDPRVAAAEVEYRRADAYLNSEWFSNLPISDQRMVRKLGRLTNKRMLALTKKKLSLWIALLFHLPDYWRWRGPQGILNDFHYITSK